MGGALHGHDRLASEAVLRAAAVVSRLPRLLHTAPSCRSRVALPVDAAMMMVWPVRGRRAGPTSAHTTVGWKVLGGRSQAIAGSHSGGLRRVQVLVRAPAVEREGRMHLPPTPSVW